MLFAFLRFRVRGHAIRVIPEIEEEGAVGDVENGREQEVRVGLFAGQVPKRRY